jgi:hypothetical protein
MKRALAILMMALVMAHLTTIQVWAAPVVTGVTDKEGNPISGGVYDDDVKVVGHGVTAGVAVNLYWDSVQSWDGEKGLIGSSEAKPDGSFSVSFKVPEATNGPHYLWVREGGGATAGPVAFEVDAVIRLSTLSGRPGDSVTIKGHGFGKQVSVVTRRFGTDTLTTNPSLPMTNSVGFWTAAFTVPSKPDGDYTVMAEDSGANSDSVVFKIGPAVSLDAVKGPVGKIVRATGRGFTPSGTVTSMTLGGVGCGVLDISGLNIDSGGGFRLDFVVPGVSDVDEHTLQVGDSGGKVATLYFNVTGLAKIEIDPMFGPPGSSVSISGVNFAPNRDVDVSLGGSSKTFKASSAGGFSGTFTIPAISTGTYEVKAKQVAFNIEAKKPIRVGTMIVILSPTSGPTGKRVALTGTGFTPGGTWNATMGGQILFSSGAVSGDTTLFGLFYVPTIDPGVYTVTVTDEAEGIRVASQFNVTEGTSLEVDPTVAPVGYNVTLEGSHFAESDGDVEVSFVVYNATDEWVMDARSGGQLVTTGGDGSFVAWWVVPGILSRGGYTINATDEEGLFAQYGFTVGSSIVSISSRKNVYARGNTVGFNIESSFREEGSYIDISNPSGNLHWRTDDLNTWIRVDVTYVAPLYTQTAGGNPMVLESDAPLGTWSYAWYDDGGKRLGLGSFVVSESAPQDDEETGDGNVTDAQYKELMAEIGALRGEVSQLKSQIAALLANVEAVSASTSAALNEVVDDLEDLGKDAAEAQEDVDEAKAVAAEAKSAVETVRSDSTNALERSKSLFNVAYGALAVSLAAILLAFVGPVKISRRQLT